MVEKFVVIETIAPEKEDTLVGDEGPVVATFPIVSEPVDTKEEAQNILDKDPDRDEEWHAIASIEI